MFRNFRAEKLQIFFSFFAISLVKIKNNIEDF